MLLAACSGSKHGSPADSAAAAVDDSATTETTIPDPWLTEVATATVPEVQVLTTKPPEAGQSPTSAPLEGQNTSFAAPAAPAASRVSDIPRDGLNSAGVRKIPTGFAFANPTYFKNPLVFMVTEDDGDWLKVQVLARPNSQDGWIKRSDVTVSSIRTHMELNKATFHLKAFDGDTLVSETDVVIGKDSTFTPVGRFYLTEKISKPESGAYGPWVLATSAYSEALDTFDGGLPQVAFHGTNNPSLIGTQSSNGCVRMPNAVDQILHDQMPAGTPITITA
jgi:lipoprotein-anchoring transpeptidase ErfK/SrfK